MTLRLPRWPALSGTAVLILLTLAGLWPALVNGGPFFMADTPSYIRAADAAVYELTGVESAWTGELKKRYPETLTTTTSSAEVKQTGASSEPTQRPVSLAGRSIFYGALLLVAQLPGSFWAAAVLQSALVALCILLTVSRLAEAGGRPVHPSNIGVYGLLLVALTPLAYFTSYLLPDIFGGIAVLAFGQLTFFWNEARPLERTFWFSALLSALSFHNSNLLLVGGLMLLASMIWLMRLIKPNPLQIGTLTGALVGAILCQSLFSWAVEKATGAAPVRPPFLAARLIDDGPGHRYLIRNCPEVGLIYCRTVSFKNIHSDLLLWSTDPNQGTFQALEPDEQRRAAREEMGFVLNVVKERPAEVLAGSLTSFGRQILMFDLSSFNYTDSNIEYFERKIPMEFLAQTRDTKAYNKKMPVRFTEIASAFVAGGSLLALVLFVFRSFRRGQLRSPASLLVVTVLIAFLMNAAITGMASNPKGRYQMRLVWILPLIAISVMHPLGATRRKPHLQVQS